MASFDSQVLGLFADPNLVQTQVTREIDQSTPNFSFAPAQSMFQALSPLVAATDPRTRNARVITETAQETPGEFGTPAYYMDLAERLRQKGMIQAAMALTQKATEMKDAVKDSAMAEFGKISFKDYGSYSVPIASLINQYATATNPQQKAQLFNKINEMMAKGRAEVQSGDVNDAAAIAKAKATAEQKVIRKGKLLDKLAADREAANAGATLISDIERNIIDPLNDGLIYTGPGADYRATFMAFANMLFPGALPPDVQEKIGRTQSAANVIGDALLGKIKQLGTNPSNADREFIAAMLPQVNQDPNAIRLIYQYMLEKQLYAQEEMNAREQWLSTHDDLTGYVAPQAQRLNEMLQSLGIDTSTENTRPNASINSVGRVRVPTIKEDLSGPQIRRMDALVNAKGGYRNVEDFLFKKKDDGTIDPDEMMILMYINSLEL